MSGDWRERSLAELSDNFDGIRVPVKEADRRVGPYPYYGASGIVDHVDNYLFDGEYLLVAEDGENLRTRNTPVAFLARGKFWVNNHAHIVRGNSEADTRFLMYALSAADISGYLTGSTMPKLTQGNMNRIPLLAPPLPEQRAIAHILGTLDDKIELNRQMNETLESIAQTIFKSWFVDGDANGESGKVGDIVMLSRETINPREFPQETFDHYSIPAFDEEHLPKAETGEQIQSNKFIVPMGSVLLSKLNPRIPRVWLPNVSQTRRSFCSTEFLVAIPKPGISREYVYGLFKPPSFLDLFATLITGTSGSHQRVKPEYLLAMDVDVPAKERIARYTGLVKPLHDRVALNLEESRTFAALRDALLPKLISGELRVKNPERIVAGASV
jgi:type I restriction enzyme S subunit